MNTGSAWREILARIFDGFRAQEGAAPDWLVNPATNRRLKLGYFYPEAGVGVRFRGSLGQRKAPPSEQEIAEEKARNRTREELCEAQGVSLVTIDLVQGEPRAVLRDISAALSRGIRSATRGDRPRPEQTDLVRRLQAARSRSDSLQVRIRSSEDLALYADLWQDRLYAVPPRVRTQRPTASREASPAYREGSRVEHDRFGVGTVVGVETEGEETFVRVRFDDGTERRFAAHLVKDRMRLAVRRRAGGS